MSSELITFFLISLAAAVTPGASTLLAFNNGLNYSLPKAFLGMLGHFTGVSLYIFVSILVLMGVVNLHESFLSLIALLGAIYILYLGYVVFRSEANVAAQEGEVKLNGIELYRRSFFTILANPKAIVYFVSVMPMVFKPEAGYLIFLATLILLVSFIGMACYIFFGFLLKRRTNQVLNSSINKVSGIVIILGGFSVIVHSLSTFL